MGDSEFNTNIGSFFKNEEMHLRIAQSPRRIKEKNIQVFSHEDIGANRNEGCWQLQSKGHKSIGKSFGVWLRSIS